MSTSRPSYQPALEMPAEEPSVPAWKMELNARLAAHRQRQGSESSERHGSEARRSVPPNMPSTSESSARAASVAARVAERYAKAPSYSEYLAASAAAAAAAAETAAFAARQAHEAAEAFARLSAAQHATAPGATDEQYEALHEPAGFAPVRLSPDELSPLGHARRAEMPEPDRLPTVEHPAPLPARGAVPARPNYPSASLFEHSSGLVDPLAEAMVPAAVPLPAKLIEFPRELIAPRKSRPRLAEGPLGPQPAPCAPLFAQLDSDLAPPLAPQLTQEFANDPSSLRIFEVDRVEGETMASEPGPSPRQTDPSLRPAHAVPGEGYPSLLQSSPAADDRRDETQQPTPSWQSIRLGEHPSGDAEALDAPLPSELRSREETPLLHTASLADRTMSALVDLCVVLGAFLLFVLLFASCTAHPPVDKAALGCAGAILAGIALFYQWLFMSYGGGTLGMRYARIAICTFDDDNPTRSTMRRRVTASLLSGLPLGLGFLWALFDEDSLGWHDRLSRSYQRSYR